MSTSAAQRFSVAANVVHIQVISYLHFVHQFTQNMKNWFQILFVFKFDSLVLKLFSCFTFIVLRPPSNVSTTWI